MAQHFASLRTSHIPALTPPNSARVGQFHRDLKSSSGPNLEQLQVRRRHRIRGSTGLSLDAYPVFFLPRLTGQVTTGRLRVS